MSEVFNNDFTSESNQQPSNSYPYSFEQPAAAQPQPSAPAPEQKKKAARPERSLRCFWPVHLWAAAPASERPR